MRCQPRCSLQSRQCLTSSNTAGRGEAAVRGEPSFSFAALTASQPQGPWSGGCATSGTRPTPPSRPDRAEKVPLPRAPRAAAAGIPGGTKPRSASPEASSATPAAASSAVPPSSSACAKPHRDPRIAGSGTPWTCERAWDGLPSSDRALLLMVGFHVLTAVEAADVLKISPEARQRLHRARGCLRLAMDAACPS